MSSARREGVPETGWGAACVGSDHCVRVGGGTLSLKSTSPFRSVPTSHAPRPWVRGTDARGGGRTLQRVGCRCAGGGRERVAGKGGESAGVGLAGRDGEMACGAELYWCWPGAGGDMLWPRGGALRLLGVLNSL